MNDNSAPPKLNSVVLVRGGNGRTLFKPWRGRVVSYPEVAKLTHATRRDERVAVLPLERGPGWSTEPVVVRLSILERE
jgi:hypothetical protein